MEKCTICKAKGSGGKMLIYRQPGVKEGQTYFFVCKGCQPVAIERGMIRYEAPTQASGSTEEQG